MTRVPDGEEDRLQRLSEELRRACAPGAELSAGFAARLEQRLAEDARWGRLVRRSPLLRVAASLLVACSLAAPATALLAFLARGRPEAPVLGFEPALPPAIQPRREAEAHVESMPPPVDLLETGWPQVRERENRMAAVSVQWREQFPRSGRAVAGLPAGLVLPEGARIGLEYRLGLRSPGAESLALSWGDQPPELLWAELERRLARGETERPPAGLAARVEELWRERTDASTRGWLAIWLIVLHGPGAAAGYPLPHPGGDAARVFWEAVQWRPQLLSSGSRR